MLDYEHTLVGEPADDVRAHVPAASGEFEPPEFQLLALDRAQCKDFAPGQLLEPLRLTRRSSV
jgi:hypothetical protein